MTCVAVCVCVKGDSVFWVHVTLHVTLTCDWWRWCYAVYFDIFYFGLEVLAGTHRRSLSHACILNWMARRVWAIRVVRPPHARQQLPPACGCAMLCVVV